MGKFSNVCSERSEIWERWHSVLKLITFLKGCVAVVGEDNGEVHFHKMQRLLPVFCMSGCISYLNYASCYLKKWGSLKKITFKNLRTFSKRKPFSENKWWIFQESNFRNQNTFWYFKRRNILECSLFEGEILVKT